MSEETTCPHGIPRKGSCSVRCVCSHRCDAHDHGPHNFECWGSLSNAGLGYGGELCECERFTAQGGEG